jgi:hypothetical protein
MSKCKVGPTQVVRNYTIGRLVKLSSNMPMVIVLSYTRTPMPWWSSSMISSRNRVWRIHSLGNQPSTSWRKLALLQSDTIMLKNISSVWLFWKNSFSKQHVPHHEGNVEYWVIDIFRSCHKHNDLLYMIFHIHSHFSNGDNPEQAKKLLEHTEAIRDAVFLQANALKSCDWIFQHVGSWTQMHHKRDTVQLHAITWE